MFKNIELSEINNDRVVQSLWVLFSSIGAFMIVGAIVRFGMGNDEFSIGLIFYYLLQVIFFGWPMWGGIWLLFYIIERFTLGKKSTTKTVAILFIVEMILPFLFLIIVLAFENRANFLGLIVLVPVILAQCIRWKYLKHKNRMYNFIK